MKRRLTIIVLALILAAVGTSGVLAYVKRANARALAGLRAVSVLVAQKRIPSGTTATIALGDGSLASERLPATSVPPNALSTVPAALSSLVLSGALEPGQLLLRPMLVTPVQVTSGLVIPRGLMAVTVSFCLPEVVAGAVHPGSQVAVFDTVGPGGGSPISGQPGCAGAHVQTSGSARTRVVLERVHVLSVGSAPTGSGSVASTIGGGASSAAGTLVTLAVSQVQAQRLIQLTETGLPYLALLTSTSQTTTDIGNLLDVQSAPSHTPKPSPSPTLPPLPFPTVTPSPTPSH